MESCFALSTDGAKLPAWSLRHNTRYSVEGLQ
jgi:hypothetical protein